VKPTIAFTARRNSKESFALVITLIMVALAAVIVVGLLISASFERLSADAYRNRLRAEIAAQSGLAAALNALAGASGPNDFRFVTAVGDDGKPVLIPLTKPDPTTGSVSLDTASKRLLYSNSAASATLTLSTVTNPRVTRQAGYIPITDSSNQEIERYAFYIDEGGSRQNLAMQGGSDRIYARDPNELPVVTATAAPTPFTSAQTQALKDNRPLLFTPSTANPVLSPNPVTPPVDNYSYATASAIANVTPEGKPRVNLLKLKSYVDGLPVDQTSGNPRAALVDRLLSPSEQGNEWGGGNLSFLTKLTHYSATQCKQIIANLLDYMDEDVFPTTDNVDNPTYFGVEGRADSSDKVQGHPYVVFVGTGMVFNRSSAPPGALNSTRVLVFLGLANPWGKPTADWATFYQKPELEVVVTGTATGGNLGSDAGAYFKSTFSTADSSNNLLTVAAASIAPNTSIVFPGPPSGNNYANFNDMRSAGQQQPPNMDFTNLGFKIKRLRLKYTSTDGRSGYIQVLDGLGSIAQPNSPNSSSMSTTSGALVYKFPNNNPKEDFHLNSDPRLDFVATRWTLSRSTDQGSVSPTPQTTLSIFAVSDQSSSDFFGGAPVPSDSTWYKGTDASADFFVKSPPKDGSAPHLDSAGELGYLHTGIPWETLRFYVTGNETNGKERDREFLAYIHSGTFAGTDYSVVPTHLGQSAPATPIPLLGGPININTNKRSTLQSLFLGASATLDSDATSRAKGTATDPDAPTLADGLAANAATAPFALPGDYFSLPAVKTVTNAQTTDFNREVLARRTANVIGSQSTRFTVYSLGEARDKAGANILTTSTVNLRAEVELQTDSNGKPMPKVLSTAYYLSN
jgi:hypothetical protein